MHRLASSAARCALRRNALAKRGFASTSVLALNHPNPPLHLDPSLQTLLRDVDISLSNYKAQGVQPLRQLEVVPLEAEEDGNASAELLEDSREQMEEVSRKSPAALFGSQGVGAVVLPAELQHAINAIISDSDKTQLHSDAKRLFQSDIPRPTTEESWDAQYDVRYRSKRQAARHHERDGIAFASVALPAHYSAIYAVLEHVKRRLEPDWKVRHVIDWGAGTGSGLLATSYAFQKQSAPDVNMEDLAMNNTALLSYSGIDKREGLISIGKKLHRGLNSGDLKVSWHKSFQQSMKEGLDGNETLAVSAFVLSTLSTDVARKNLVKEMWESGAQVMVLLDHKTPSGYEAIAEAREFLLSRGRKEAEAEDPTQSAGRGSHVVAPCPHDAACPLYRPGGSRLVCGFSQRLQRPGFVRRTKHSGTGHEDIEYSYAVIRRGSRPSAARSDLGRVGEVGRRASDKTASRAPIRELRLHDEDTPSPLKPQHTPTEDPTTVAVSPTPAEVHEALRQESFQWPRLVFPPLKRPGHVILDSCTAEGKIMRLTIPKSQGKQAYYDARKSGWGDIFPHPPKNPPQVRSLAGAEGSDIGKRRDSDRKKEPISFRGLVNETKDPRKKSRRDRT